MSLPGWDSLTKVTSISYLLQGAVQVFGILAIVCGLAGLVYTKRRDKLQDREASRQSDMLRAEAASQAERARADAERRVAAAQADADRKVAALTSEIESKAAEAMAALERESQARSLSERASEAHRQNLAGGGKNVKSGLVWKDGHIVGNSVAVGATPAAAAIGTGRVTAASTSGPTPDSGGESKSGK